VELVLTLPSNLQVEASKVRVKLNGERGKSVKYDDTSKEVTFESPT